MTRYLDFNKLRELTTLTKTAKGYSKFIQTGEIEFFDYNVGFFDVEVYPFKTSKGVNFVRIWFGTIDDGDYGGWLDVKTSEEAINLADRIANEVFKDMVALPTLEELNERLYMYGGIQVGYE